MFLVVLSLTWICRLTIYLIFNYFSNSIFGAPFWENLKDILNPGTSVGAKPWVYYTIYAFFVFLFNIFDIVSISCSILLGLWFLVIHMHWLFFVYI